MNKACNFLSKHPVAAALGFATLCLLPVMMMRDLSPSNELRYLSIADEAIRDGHIFAFTNQGLPYADKPPLYFWLIMLCKLIFGAHKPLVLCMFSLIPAIGITVVMDKWAGPKEPGRKAAMALLSFSCFLFLGMAVFLRMDMLMMLFIVLTMHSFWMLYTGEGNQRLQSWLLPLWIFLALFTKGPVGVMMPPLAILCFLIWKRQFKSIGKYLGWKTWGVLAGLCAIWFAGVYLDGGSDYLNNLLFHQTVGRAVNAFHHKQPFYYYLEVYWAAAAPWCLLLASVLAYSLIPSKDKDAPKAGDKEILFATTVLSTTVMLSAFSSKLTIYLAPILPFLCYLAPLVIERKGWKRIYDWSLAIPAAILFIGSVAGIAALTIFKGNNLIAKALEQYPFACSWPVIVGLALLGHGSLSCLLGCFKNSEWSKRVFAMAGSLLAAVVFISAEIPAANDFIGYRNLCSLVPQDSQVATLHVHRPENMDVYLGRDIIDFQKDEEKLMGSLDSLQNEGGRLTLIIKTSRISPAIDSISRSIATCGEYSILEPISLP